MSTALINDLLQSYGSDQVLPVDAAAAEQCAIIASTRERAGKPIAGSTCLSQPSAGLVVLRWQPRNLADFDETGIDIIDRGPQPTPERQMRDR